jgi:hypothetical protein
MKEKERGRGAEGRGSEPQGGQGGTREARGGVGYRGHDIAGAALSPARLPSFCFWAEVPGAGRARGGETGGGSA